MSSLYLVSMLLPLAAAALLAPPQSRRFALALAPWVPLPALLTAVLPPPADLASPVLLFGLRLGLDPVARTFLLFTALLWLIAGIGARRYHRDDPHRARLWGFWLLSLTGNLWLVLSHDAAGFYAGFALMTFSGYGLVVHGGSSEGRRAGRIYMILALLGEMALLSGLLLAVAAGSGLDLPLRPIAGDAAGPAIALLLAGFGVKAGMAGLHMWLPLAHPVAPTPASAVLSGAMIKAGLLGWLRFLPLGAESWPRLGPALMLLACLAIFGAVIVGLLQRAPKTVLAYSSVSQMGYPTLVIGATLIEPRLWPAAATTVAFYACHHALAKGALFLTVGAAPALSPRGRLACITLPALALAGAPLTTGVLAKSALQPLLAALPPPWNTLPAMLLGVAATGTTLMMARFARLLVAADPGPAAPQSGTGPAAAAVLASTTVPWLLLPSLPAASAAAGALSALLPIGIGAIIAVALRRFEPRSQWPAGDLIALLEPAGRRSGAVLLGACATRLPAWSTGAAAARLRVLAADAESALRRPRIAGVLLLALLLMLVAAI